MNLEEIVLTFSPWVFLQFIVVQPYVIWCARNRKQKPLSKRTAILGIGSMSLMVGNVILLQWMLALQRIHDRNAICVGDLAVMISLTVLMVIVSYTNYLWLKKDKPVSKKIVITAFGAALVGLILIANVNF